MQEKKLKKDTGLYTCMQRHRELTTLTFTGGRKRNWFSLTPDDRDSEEQQQ